jgi:hypothetical protein
MLPITQTFPFRFSRSDVALIVELYLPKRAQYQALLLQVLSSWYEWERRQMGETMKTHFRDNKPRILELLEHYSSLHAGYDRIVEGFPLELAVGHSVYEVDGLFADVGGSAIAKWVEAAFDAGGLYPAPSLVQSGVPVVTSEAPTSSSTDTTDSTAAPTSTNGFAAEERTLVVRFIFPFPERTLVDLAARSFGSNRGYIEPLFREAIRGFLQTPSGHRPEEYTERLFADSSYRAALEKFADGRHEAALDHVKTLVGVTNSWIHCVALWLFGYLVLKVTAGMNQLVVDGTLAKNEDVIWITSFWDVALNRISPTLKEPVT